MITIYLVRHASHTKKYKLLPGRLPVELSKEGKREAEKLRNYFKDKNINKIFSSAVLRCKQTAEIISDGKITIEYDLRLLEVLSAYQGFWNPKAWDQFWGHRRALGGENDADVEKRVLDFFESSNFEKENNYVISSHGDPLYYIYQKISGVPPLAEIELGDEVITPDDYQKKGSIRIIKKENEKWSVERTLNQHEL